jgi:hypothetical protein
MWSALITELKQVAAAWGEPDALGISSWGGDTLRAEAADKAPRKLLPANPDGDKGRSSRSAQSVRESAPATSANARFAETGSSYDDVMRFIARLRVRRAITRGERRFRPTTHGDELLWLRLRR